MKDLPDGTPVSERDVLVQIRTDIADTEIEIEAIKTYGVKSEIKRLPQLAARLRSLKTQFHTIRSLWGN